MILLSIVIPAYNSAQTLTELLSSIFASNKVNFEEIEIIIVDDKSEDQTVHKVIKFIKSNTLRTLQTRAHQQQQSEHGITSSSSMMQK